MAALKRPAGCIEDTRRDFEFLNVFYSMLFSNSYPLMNIRMCFTTWCF